MRFTAVFTLSHFKSLNFFTWVLIVRKYDPNNALKAVCNSSHYHKSPGRIVEVSLVILSKYIFKL